MPEPPLRVSVVVPSYRRPRELSTCLSAIHTQRRPPDQVVVSVRDGDDETLHVTRSWPDVAVVMVDEPGVIVALSAAVSVADGDVVAFTDDDAVPPPDWLERLLLPFADPTIGAVGGRDLIEGQRGPTTLHVGMITRWGKLVGNHHLGEGPPRRVDVLKGVNMAFRSSAVSMPRGLQGEGAQVHWELAVCRHAQNAGWTLVYDPAIVVDHRPGERFDADRRVRPHPSAMGNAAYNLVAALVATEPRLRWRRAAFGLLIGDRATPGALVGAAGVATRRLSSRQVVHSLRGQFSALVRPSRRLLSLEDVAPAPRRRRLVVVAHEVHRHGGMERATAELVDAASAQFDVTVVAAELEVQHQERVKWLRVRLPRRPFPARFMLFWLLAGRAARRARPDVLHTVGAIVPTPADVAAVHFCHAAHQSLGGGRSARSSLGLRRWNHAISERLSVSAEKRVYRAGGVRRVAAVSKGLAQELQTYYPGIPVEVVRNGIDHDRFRPSTQTRKILRTKLGLADDELVVLFVGGDWERKGLNVAINGFASIPEELRGRARLWVVGLGDIALATTVARRAGIESRCTFFGLEPDPAAYYQAADVLVLPSAYETFSLVCYEAASCGLPVVATAVSGVDELIGDGECGVVVTRDPTSVGEGLAKVLSNDEHRSLMGARARARVAGLTWEASTKAILELYET